MIVSIVNKRGVALLDGLGEIHISDMRNRAKRRRDRETRVARKGW